MDSWGFYGRQMELDAFERVLKRNRWFFIRVSGRRRIGKTTLIQEVLDRLGGRPVLYVPIPDSDPAGVLTAVADYMGTFSVNAEPPNSLKDFAALIARLVRAGTLVALDEFQFFHRKSLFEFTSFLQAEVDALGTSSAALGGGLIVLGSIHTEMMALLDDRSAPLYNRVSDAFHLDHLDIESVLHLLSTHADTDPRRLLFLWNLFEGVPKFYRDCFEQEVLDRDRKTLLRRMFFSSSSPLRHEAENWFLSQLRGRYDTVLKFIARHPGCTNAEIVAYASSIGKTGSRQVGGYLQVLRERFQMVEHLQPIFAKPSARRGRYYIKDNFLRSWLEALAVPTAAVNFKPVDDLVVTADENLQKSEGYGLERLLRQLYEERSRKGLGDFKLDKKISGYWDRAGTEIDFIGLNEEDRVVRLGSCKRRAEKLAPDFAAFDRHIERFLSANRRFQDWSVQKMAFTVAHSAQTRKAAQAGGYIPEDLADLTAGFSHPSLSTHTH